MRQATRFTAAIVDRSTGVVRSATLPARPLRWSDHEIGGPEQATLEVTEPRQRLIETLDWLGADVEIYNAAGTCVWWGFVNEVELQVSGLQLRYGLDGLANRIAVAYTTTDGTGASQRATTAYVSDAASVAVYGTKELLLSLPEGDSGAAESLRTQALAIKALPALAIQPASDGEERAQLNCVGPFAKLDWRYYSQAAGQEMYEVDADQEQPLAAEYSANTIDFTAADNIYDAGNGLAWTKPGENIVVSGSAQAGNNTSWEVQDVVSGHINVEPDSIVTSSDSPARTIVVARGTARSTKVAQSFQLSSSLNWDLFSAALLLKRYGNPTDSIKLELCSDSAGAPGTVLESSQITAAAISADALAWVEFSFGGTTQLATSTTYWLVLSRTGSADAWHYCAVGWATAAGYTNGQCKLYNGAAWVAPPVTVDVPFKLAGKRLTTAQISDIVLATGEYTGVDLMVSSGRYTPQYRTGDRRSSDEVVELLRLGLATDQRLLATVTRERRVVVTTPPLASEVRYSWRRDGQLRSVIGNGPVEPGQLLAGEYLALDLPATIASAGAALSPVYLQASAYDADNQQWSWTAANAVDLFDFGAQQG